MALVLHGHGGASPGGAGVKRIRLSVFQRIAAGYAVVLVIMLLIGLITFVRAQQQRAHLQDFAGQEVPALITLNDLGTEIYVEEVPLTRYGNSPLFGQAREDLLIPYFRTQASIRADLGVLGRYAAGNPEVTKPLADLKTAVEAREADAAGDMVLLQAGRPALEVLTKNFILIEAVQQADDALSTAIEKNVDADAATANTDATVGLVLIAAFFLLAGLVTIVAGLWSARAISRPLASLTHGAERIARGESVDLPRLDRRDEIGILSAAVIKMVESLREITEKERQQAEELKRSNGELEQFAYIASHDLQEPLRMVGSYTSLLERRYKGKLDADADEFIGFAMEGVTRMRSLINDLLTYSRVGKEEKASAPTDSRAALDRALANLQVTIAERGAVVVMGNLPMVMGNGPQLTQVFQNLIGNGLKFCKEGRPEIKVSVERQGADWVFSVGDNGIGIDPQYADRIFLIFQRLHKRDEYEGTGIGLAICKKIVERHGGRIWVESEPGKGATFRFTLQMTHELKAAA